jgi:hypothetical protein
MNALQKHTRAAQDQFEAKNTGVGTEEIEQIYGTLLGPGASQRQQELNLQQFARLQRLYPNVPFENLPPEAFSQGGEDRLRVSIFH